MRRYSICRCMRFFNPSTQCAGSNGETSGGVEGTGFVRALRSLLTSHLPKFQPELERIIHTTLDNDLKDVRADGYTHAKIFPLMKSLVTKVNCFIFFGAELCAGVIASVVALRARVKLFGSSDLTWLESQLFICIIVENNIALIVCCVPAFKNACKKYIAPSRPWKVLMSTIHRRHDSKDSDKDGHGDEEKGGGIPNNRGEDKRVGDHQITQGYSLNRDSSKESYEHRDSMEKTSKGFVSYGRGAGSSGSSDYPSRVVQIQGGPDHEQEGTNNASNGPEGIMRDIEIRQEVRPEDVV
ncbi:hypothetical protein MKX07_007410 [Trichoderma sp. CBMAI-0711]|nr:hypothetical protein MKX07_007410 [Trichoderma sp. CBMAI-0711]